MAMSFADESGSAFFGPSSNIAFTRHILGAMASHNITQPQTLTALGNRSAIDSGMLEFSRSSSPANADGHVAAGDSKPGIFELPPVAEM